jgi:hypothetical protein
MGWREKETPPPRGDNSLHGWPVQFKWDAVLIMGTYTLMLLAVGGLFVAWQHTFKGGEPEFEYPLEKVPSFPKR